MKRTGKVVLCFLLTLAMVLPLGAVPVRAGEETYTIPVEGRYESVEQEAILAEINRIRKDAVETLKFKSEYKPISWDNENEQVARERALEASYNFITSRPTGGEIGQESLATLTGASLQNVLKMLKNWEAQKNNVELKDGKLVVKEGMEAKEYLSLISYDYVGLALFQKKKDADQVWYMALSYDDNKSAISTEPGSSEVSGLKVNRSLVSVVGFEDITTFVGVEPALPEKAKLKVKVGNKEFELECPVKWTKTDIKPDAKAGDEYLVDGVVRLSDDVNNKIETSVKVKVVQAKDFTFAPLPIQVLVKGQKPTLPKLVTVTFKDKKTADLPIDWSECKEPEKLPTDLTVEGTIRATDVKVKLPILWLVQAPDSIEVKTPLKNPQYYQNDESKLNEERLLLHYKDEKIEDLSFPLREEWVIGFSTEKIGEITVKVKFLTLETSFKLTILQNRKVNRIGGSNRYETALKISRQYFDQADTVVFARGDRFADALTAAPYAKGLNAPILLVSGKQLDATIQAEMKRLGAKKVVIVGGEAAVSKELETATKALEGVTVTRLAGENRYETSVQVSKAIFKLNQELGRENTRAILASGEVAADALSAAPYASKTNTAILLTSAKELSKATKEGIQELKLDSITVLGGAAAITKETYESVQDLVRVISRVQGETRYETAIEIAKLMNKDQVETVFLATGLDFADALVIGGVAGRLNAPLLLTAPKVLPKTVKEYIESYMPSEIAIIGEKNAVSKEVEESITIKKEEAKPVPPEK